VSDRTNRAAYYQSMWQSCQQRLAAAEAERDQLARLVHHCPVCGEACKNCQCMENRLAAAEALADHVSFEHEVDMQTLEARLAVSNALLREACEGMDLEKWDAWEQRAKEVTVRECLAGGGGG